MRVIEREGENKAKEIETEERVRRELRGIKAKKKESKTCYSKLYNEVNITSV